MRSWKVKKMLHKAKRILCVFLAGSLLCLSVPAGTLFAAEKVMTMNTCRSLALENSASYEGLQSAVESKQAARDSAIKALKLKKKKLTTFSWSPLLSFKFPQKLSFAQSSEFEFKPVKLANDILVAQHKVQNAVFGINENINNLYTDIVSIQENLDFNEKRLKTLEDGIAHNKARLKIGEANQADIDRQEKQAQTLSNTIASDRRTLEADLKKLSKQIGLDVTTGYTFEKPFVEADIDRSALEGLKQYAEDRDEAYYEACMAATTARMELSTNYNLMNGKYGGDMRMISGYVNQALNDQDVSARAFKKDYKAFLDKIDSYWNGHKRILFIKIPREWFKGSMDGARWIDDDPYTLYQNVLDYVSARKDMEAARDELDQSVEDSFNNYISVRAAYQGYIKDLDKKEKDMDVYAAKNRMGSMTLEEYETEQKDYEDMQNSLLDTMKLYTTTLYSLDKLTCGGISAYLSGTDADMQTAVVGESYVEKDTTEAKYYLRSIIQKEMFELSIFIPDGFPVEISDFELWCDNEMIGERTPIDKTLRHLALTKDNVKEVKIRLYNGDDFVDDCLINPDEESGTLNVTTAMDIRKDETGDLGTYDVTTSQVTGMASIRITPLESEGIKFYRIITTDGTPLGTGEVLPVDKEFRHLGLVGNGLNELNIELYTTESDLKTVGRFDTGNKKITSKESAE
ncbi:MAG: hypothetical protein IJU87_01870 [Lachnospiraceae bacterium]|nr:hypothetical protein [Lachnospiraceae bacterium]